MVSKRQIKGKSTHDCSLRSWPLMGLRFEHKLQPFSIIDYMFVKHGSSPPQYHVRVRVEDDNHNVFLQLSTGCNWFEADSDL